MQLREIEEIHLLSTTEKAKIASGTLEGRIPDGIEPSMKTPQKKIFWYLAVTATTESEKKQTLRYPIKIEGS